MDGEQHKCMTDSHGCHLPLRILLALTIASRCILPVHGKTAEVRFYVHDVRPLSDCVVPCKSVFEQQPDVPRSADLGGVAGSR